MRGSTGPISTASIPRTESGVSVQIALHQAYSALQFSATYRVIRPTDRRDGDNMRIVTGPETKLQRLGSGRDVMRPVMAAIHALRAASLCEHNFIPLGRRME